MSTPAILDCQVSYQNVMVTSENKLVYLLADVLPGKTTTTEGTTAMNLAVVLDKSGSMYAAEKLEYVVSAVQHLIDQLRPNDICSIIAFADKARVVIPAGPIHDKESAKRIIRNIDHIDVGSGTEMLRGINASMEQISTNFSKDRTNHCILLTDGLTLHERKCKTRCIEGSERGISFSTIGVGDDFNEKLLLDIANGCRGKSYYIDIPRDIPEIFTQELTGVQSVTVLNPKISVKVAKGVDIRRAHKVKPLINDLGSIPTVDRVATIKLQDLQKNEVQSVMYELVLPSRRAGTYRVAQVKLSYEIPLEGMREETLEKDITITYTTDSRLASRVNPKVIQIVDLVSVFRQQTKALEFAQAGDRTKATRLLRSAATTLLQHGQKDLADQAMEEAKRIEGGARMTSRGTKKLEYGTRKLTQLLDQVPPIN
ncbi:MAG: VWA domain-containing protein [Candidatus Eremiobacteraeota bacterium]|nr:VWA domain-containing protein [Candidatus Eremiobacteraeota bacterium]